MVVGANLERAYARRESLCSHARLARTVCRAGCRAKPPDLLRGEEDDICEYRFGCVVLPEHR